MVGTLTWLALGRACQEPHEPHDLRDAEFRPASPLGTRMADTFVTDAALADCLRSLPARHTGACVRDRTLYAELQWADGARGTLELMDGCGAELVGPLSGSLAWGSCLDASFAWRTERGRALILAARGETLGWLAGADAPAQGWVKWDVESPWTPAELPVRALHELGRLADGPEGDGHHHMEFSSGGLVGFPLAEFRVTSPTGEQQALELSGEAFGGEGYQMVHCPEMAGVFDDLRRAARAVR